MSRVHVYPQCEENLHNLENSADCKCEPKVIDEGLDMNGQRALVFVHQPLIHIEIKTMIKRYE